MSDTKAVIKSVDMSEEMQQEAIECSTQALEKYNIEKDIAAHIKREFDRKYGKDKMMMKKMMMMMMLIKMTCRSHLALCGWT